jgi:hypothetical protein
MSRILAAALLLAMALPAGAQIKWGDQFDELTCAQWEPLDMTDRIEKLKAIQPFGDDLEQADRGAAEQWEAEVAAACKGHPDRLLRDAAAQALGPT